jgi:hypothetical protein
MRTAPVVELTQAKMLVEAGAAHAAEVAKSVTARRTGFLREVIDSSGEGRFVKR